MCSLPRTAGTRRRCASRTSARCLGLSLALIAISLLLLGLFARARSSWGPRPEDQTTYEFSNEQSAARCRSVGLCESAQLSCSVADRVASDRTVRDCALSNTTTPSARAEAIRHAISSSFAAYR